MRTWLPAALVLGALVGCGDTSDTSAGVLPAPTRLEVTQTTDRTQTWTLPCDPTGGDHPSPAPACGAVMSLERPFAPLAEDVVCTQQYGGDQTARVTGVLRGMPVDLALSRTDGCRIAQWDRLGALLPGPVGVAP